MEDRSRLDLYIWKSTAYRLYLKVIKLDVIFKMYILDKLPNSPQLIFLLSETEPWAPCIIDFIQHGISYILFLCLYVTLRKYLENYMKVSVIKQPLHLIYSLFLKYQKTTLAKVTSMNLSCEIEKSKDLVLPQDVTYHKANPGLNSIPLNPVSYR